LTHLRFVYIRIMLLAVFPRTLIIILLFISCGFLSVIHASEEFGYTEAKHLINMSFSEIGVIATIKVKEGEKVTAKQVLAQLDVGVLEKELAISKELFNQRKFRMDKLDELKAQGRSNPQEIDRAASDLKIEELKIQRAEAQIQSRTIISPVDGIVTEIKKDVGESVTPSTGVIITVVQLDSLIVNMFVAPEKLVNIRQGMTKALYINGGRDTLSAKVEYVSPVTDPVTKTVRIKFLIPNPDLRISSGLRVTLENPRADISTKSKKKRSSI